MRLNIPNILSLLRLFLIPVFVVVFYLPYSWAPFAAAMVFWVAGFTDWLDGMLARKLGKLQGLVRLSILSLIKYWLRQR